MVRQRAFWHGETMPASNPDEHFPAGEELAHSVTHGAGLILSIAALVVMVVVSVKEGGTMRVVACSIYGATLVILYASSTFYHALSAGRGKRVFGILDHAAIFLLIAGTYTPFTLVTMNGKWGWSIFGAVWGLAIAGVLLEVFTRGRARRLQLILYLAMGWAIVSAVKPLLRGLGTEGLVLLAAGGLAYTFGVVFFVWKKMPYHHAVWHLFVLAGSICHFFAVLLYVIP